jgi:hypothetical protein
MTQENGTETLGELMGEDAVCWCCGADLKAKKPTEIFIDEFLFEWFAYLFCNQQCRDAYIDSK